MISKYFILIFSLAPKFYYIYNEITILICHQFLREAFTFYEKSNQTDLYQNSHSQE